MDKHDYLFLRVVALVLAALFPFYWLIEFGIMASTGERRLDSGFLSLSFCGWIETSATAVLDTSR